MNMFCEKQPAVRRVERNNSNMETYEGIMAKKK